MENKSKTADFKKAKKGNGKQFIDDLRFTELLG